MPDLIYSITVVLSTILTQGLGACTRSVGAAERSTVIITAF